MSPRDVLVDPNIDDAIFDLDIQQTREEFSAWVADCIDEFDWSMSIAEMRLEHHADNDMEN